MSRTVDVRVRKTAKLDKVLECSAGFASKPGNGEPRKESHKWRVWWRIVTQTFNKLNSRWRTSRRRNKASDPLARRAAGQSPKAAPNLRLSTKHVAIFSKSLRKTTCASLAP
jgi:hypothetical protein